MDLEYSLQTCLQVYGFQPEMVMQRPNFTNEYYGGDHPMGSRIIFANGKYLFFEICSKQGPEV